MKKFNTLMTAAVIGCMGIAAGTAHAGNYRPINRDSAASQTAVQNLNNGDSVSKSANRAQAGSKTAFFYDSCYTVPVCSGSICAPATQCSSYCSPCGPRPYFPASNWGYGNGYGNYGGYGGGYNGGYGGGYGGYGGYNGGFGGYGGGLGGYGGGFGGYGGYSTPSYVAPLNPGLGSPYGAPVINGPMVNPALGNPYLSPVGGYGNPGYFPSGVNGGYGPIISPVGQPGFSSPVISQPILSNPGFNSPFYP